MGGHTGANGCWDQLPAGGNIAEGCDTTALGMLGGGGALFGPDGPNGFQLGDHACTAYHLQLVENWRVLPLFPGQAGAQLEPLQHAAKAAELHEHLWRVAADSVL